MNNVSPAGKAGVIVLLSFLHFGGWKHPSINKCITITLKQCHEGGMAQGLASRTTDQGVPGSRPGRVAVRCGLEQVRFTPCLVLVKPRKPWTYN